MDRTHNGFVLVLLPHDALKNNKFPRIAVESTTFAFTSKFCAIGPRWPKIII